MAETAQRFGGGSAISLLFPGRMCLSLSLSLPHPTSPLSPLFDQPENLILHTDEKGQDTVKLIDFGFAHVNDTPDAMMHTACTLLVTSLEPSYPAHPRVVRPAARIHLPSSSCIPYLPHNTTTRRDAPVRCAGDRERHGWKVPLLRPSSGTCTCVIVLYSIWGVFIRRHRCLSNTICQLVTGKRPTLEPIMTVFSSRFAHALCVMYYDLLQVNSVCCCAH